MHESRTNATDREPAGAMEDLARDPGSRKRFLKMVGGAGAASAFAVFLAACNSDDGGGGGGGGGSAAKPDVASPGGVASNRDRGGDPKEGTSDLDILNYALSLENLETSFYGKVIESGLFRGSQLELIKKFADNERQHRELLEATVEKLGGKPAAPKKTTFPLSSARGVLALAAEIENGGAAAYLGQANRIRDKEVLAAALSIHSVEARHAATLNGLVGLPPTPQGSFAAPLSMEEVLTTVQQFIVS
ncbi:MAG: ferritin-like domain-containing protein [Thermoleophilaceae bacterium]|nr:ferritin-like domain-containing protein [Thermoleophilaceae bacterium]